MKKKGLYDKAKTKSGVVEGGIDALTKITKMVKKKDKYEGKQVRISIWVPEALRKTYKSLMAKEGRSMQDAFVEHMYSFIEKNKKNK